MRASRRLPIETLQPYLLDLPHPGFLPPDSPLLAPAPRIVWADLFGNDNPVEVEIGFGKGLFLAMQGEARPNVNFLGVEIERKYVLLAADRVVRRKLSNAKLACTDARWFLRERVPPGSISAMHVYFPDPWWKTRHRKRKLFTREFAERCVVVLKPGGYFHFATDVADYFAESVEIVKQVPALEMMPTPAPTDEGLTNFERKYRVEGRAIYRALWRENNPSKVNQA